MKPSFINKLEQRKTEENFRQLSFVPSTNIDFFSNDYLGISKNFKNYNFSNIPFYGSTGSRLLSGNSKKAEETEHFVASFFKSDAALIFSSGFEANLGLLSSVPQRGDTIIYDELIHASLRDGIRLSLAQSFSFIHNDLDDLQKKSSTCKGTIFIVIESIYSMNGDIAPIKKMCEFSSKNGFLLIVDEAHSCGIYGENGIGLLEQEKLLDSVFARIVTFSKAFGYFGAAILGTNLLKEYLINFCRPFIYSTALPENYYTLLIEILKKDYTKNREQINQNLTYFQEKLKFKTESNALSPIKVLKFDSILKLKEKSNFLIQNSIFQKPILSPTVAKGQECLRLCIHSFNSTREMDALFEIINN